MSIKVGSKVFYPAHGAGWAKRVKKIEFGGVEKEYLEFKFINAQISVSSPLDNIDNLGIREVFSPATIRKKIGVLKKKSRLDPKAKDFTALANTLKALDEEATIEAFIKIIQHCNYVVAERIEEGRLIPVSIDRFRKNAIENIAGELAVSSDEKDFDKAVKSFERAGNTTYEIDKTPKAKPKTKPKAKPKAKK